MIRPSSILLVAGMSLLTFQAPALAAPKKPSDKVCGNTMAECEDAIVKALREGHRFTFAGAGPLPPKVAEAFVQAVTDKKYEGSSCVDKAARDSLTPDQIARLKKAPTITFFDPAQTKVDVMVEAEHILLARKSFLAKSVTSKKLPFPGDPIVVRSNPEVAEDEPLYQWACGYEVLGTFK